MRRRLTLAVWTLALVAAAWLVVMDRVDPATRAAWGRGIRAALGVAPSNPPPFGCGQTYVNDKGEDTGECR